LSAERRFDLSVAAFVGACLALMVAAPGFQTVPFHWIWIGLTLLAGVRLWPVRATWVIVAVVGAATGAVMLIPGGAGQSAVEMTEIPLMAAVYLTMVWHARRRDRALVRVDRTMSRQREFVRDAAHSLRTPLTIARGHLELVTERLPEGPERDDVGVALDELRRLSAMSDSLLLLSTADDPRFLSRRALDVGDLLADVAARWRAASGRPVGIDVAGAFTVRADEDRLRCALDALVENALRATERGGAVTVGARRDPLGVAIEVRDDGPGVPEEARERIFDRFYRVDVESVRRGSGLGLAVVKAIAKAHGGAVGLESEPGRTVFAIRLPLAAEGADVAAPRPAAPPPAAEGNISELSTLFR
jgi:two-component system, OmpR family, sensor kinase